MHKPSDHHLPSPLDRRDFIKHTSGALAAGALLGTGTGALAQEAPAKRVVMRRLGRTNVAISHIVAAWDWNEWLYEEAVSVGINYWHKIAGWRQIPEPLRKLDREAWYCDIAIDSFEEENAYEQFEWARKALKLDYIDAMKLHSICETPEDVRGKPGYMRAFERLKREGKVRHLAAAQHGGQTAAICAEMINSGWFDHLQPAVSVNPSREMLQMLQLAADKDVGIITKKTMGAVNAARNNATVRALVEKHLGKDGKWGAAVIKTMLAIPGVTAVTPRCQSFEHFIDNLSTEGIVPTVKETAAVGEIRRFAAAQVCSYCGQCLAGCPQRVAISDILRYANYHTLYGCPSQARRLYAELPESCRADRCADCGACEGACPQGMLVRRHLREALALLA